MENNNKIYITLSVFGLLSLFLIIFFIWPTLKEIKINSENLVSAKNDIVILSAQTAETKNFEKNYENYKPNLEKIDQLFIDSSNPVDFIEFLENTAGNSQITSQISLPPSSQNFQQSQGGASKDSIIFQFNSKGNFSDIMDFSKKIEAGPYFTEIESLTIQNLEASGTGVKSVPKDYASRKVNATLTIKAFTKK